MKLNWTKIMTTAGAVLLGIVVYKLVSKALGLGDATEEMFGAHGSWGCQAGQSPVFPAGSQACNMMGCCENSGGVVNYTSNGDGSGSMECMGGSFCQGQNSVTVTEPIRKAPMRKFRF